jgi:hypothetical protein
VGIDSDLDDGWWWVDTRTHTLSHTYYIHMYELNARKLNFASNNECILAGAERAPPSRWFVLTAVPPTTTLVVFYRPPVHVALISDVKRTIKNKTNLPRSLEKKRDYVFRFGAIFD